MTELPIKREDAVAFFRFQIISEMLDAAPGFVEATAKKLSQQSFHDVLNKRMISYTERTIFRYYSAYKNQGFEGLKPKTRKDKGGHPGLDTTILSDILSLKKELPSRSAAKILIMLILAKRIEEGSLNLRTINRILNQYGYTRESLLKDNRVYIKHEKEQICQMWQSDVMSSIYIPDGNGGKKLAYLIGMIDDHSRRDMHSEFYFDATLPRLEDTLKKAVTKFSAPLTLYVDNGKIFISEQFKLLCARLGIRIKYATPYNCEGKGKIERYWETVQKSFLPEVKLHHVKSLSELNDLYFAWKKTEYDDKLHESTGMTPRQRWHASLAAGTKLRFFSPMELEEIFLHAQERTVNKYGVISFEGNTYEAPGELVGKTVIVRYNPFHIDYLHVYFKDKYFGVAKVIDLKTERHKNVYGIPEESGYDSDISKMYFENIKANYQKYLEEQLGSKIDKKVCSTMPEDTNEPHPVKPPVTPEFSIGRNEFVDIVKAAIGMPELSFQEKGKLHELWDTFKEFNKDILSAILDDLSQKATDFNKNFLFYIAQIRNTYLEKLSKFKEAAND
ncbi:MAG: DDE-type integrase/transposase/recombinase [Syntrophorhabdus sp.]|nr:DDE-type integrase/transposase/recombinase [Syntrophorhabdus sp.]